MMRFLVQYWPADDTEGCLDSLTHCFFEGMSEQDVAHNFYKANPDCIIYAVDILLGA